MKTIGYLENLSELVVVCIILSAFQLLPKWSAQYVRNCIDTMQSE